jgi:hypothetical protein
MQSTLLTLTFDGAGNISGSAVQDFSGTISSTPTSATYTVSADGALTIQPTDGPLLTGGVSADGNTLVLTQITSGDSPGIAVGVKQGQSTFTDASVKGTYQMTVMNSSGMQSTLLTLTFDGAGSISGSAVQDLSGTISSTTTSATYTVSADGALTIQPTDGPLLTGGVSADGNTLVLTQITSGDSPGIAIGVHQ